MGRNSFDFSVPAMLRKLKMESTRPEPAFLGLVSVCSCAASSGVHKVRKTTRKLGHFPMSLITRNGYTAPTGFETISHRAGFGKLSLMTAFLHFKSDRCSRRRESVDGCCKLRQSRVRDGPDFSF